MNFRDIGIIISKKILTERSYIIHIFTNNNGLYCGVIKNVSTKNLSTYMEGNLVDFYWSARLHSHIGNIKCELIKSYSGFLIFDKIKLYSFNSIVGLIKLTFCEREPHNRFFPFLKQYLDHLNGDFNFREYINLELHLLNETGYSLNLQECVVTGATEELCYVSPKSGKAVSAQAGAAYKDKLLKLPAMLIDSNIEILKADKKQAFDLTTYFINRYFVTNVNQLQARKIFIDLIC